MSVKKLKLLPAGPVPAPAGNRLLNSPTARLNMKYLCDITEYNTLAFYNGRWSYCGNYIHSYRSYSSGRTN